MSMKRTKKATSKVSQTEGSLGFNPPTGGVPKWEEAIANKADDSFVAYTPSRRFAKEEYVSHAKFGKGYVVGVDGNRIEVLFEDGIRKLAHGVTA